MLSTGEYYKPGVGVGEMWDEIGRLQFDFLYKEGLLPSHTLLDIGCGSLRGGIHYIQYLDKGNYYGFDRSSFLITAALEIEIPSRNLEMKMPHLYIRDDFHFGVTTKKFDFLLAQSVFTHLTWNSILLCLCKASLVMHPDSKFYATFFENDSDIPGAIQIPQKEGLGFTYIDRDPYHYEFSTFVDLARRSGLEVKYIGDWDHPRFQKMLLFTKRT
ncbi:MAG: class I SAM-dependent methyltransferase [Anaerolineales bacterium]|nr:class I SAM-dependent methyltransferase [Anaerolineales bacterium]